LTIQIYLSLFEKFSDLQVLECSLQTLAKTRLAPILFKLPGNGELFSHTIRLEKSIGYANYEPVGWDYIDHYLSQRRGFNFGKIILRQGYNPYF
jgi:hypothetical protein